MALATTDQKNEAPRQQATPGVVVRETMPPGSTAGVGTVPLAGIGMLPGTEDGMTPIQPLGPLRPILYDDIDAILLARLYPWADDVRAAAMEAAEIRIAQGEEMMASQNEPVFFEGDGVSPEDRDKRRAEARETARGTGSRPARSGHNEPPVVRGAGTPPPGTPPPIHRPIPPPQQPTSPTPQPDHKPDDKPAAHDKKDDKK